MDKVSLPKASPQRPPPPKLVPRKAAFQTDFHASTSVDQHVDNSSKRPKPPIRTRKKKFITTEDVKQPPRQSEFVELSTSDIIVDFGSQGGEIRIVSDAAGKELKDQEKKMDTLIEDKSQEDRDREEVESGECDEKADSDPEKRTEDDLDKDEWEVIPNSATNDDTQRVIMDESCLQPNG